MNALPLMNANSSNPLEASIARLRAEAVRYYSDREYRESLPCGECGATGGCQHFPKEVAPTREP